MSSEREEWDKVAEKYSKNIESKDSPGFLIRDKVLNPYLFEAIGNVKGKNVLDYGCGDGGLCNELSKLGAQAEGVDISSKFVEIAKKKYPKIRFELMEENKTNYPDNQFDIVVCNIVLHITKDYKQVLKEIYRIAKPEGKLVVTIMHPDHWKAEQADFSKEEEIIKVMVENSVPVTYYRRGQEIYQKAFNHAGFKIIIKKECTSKEILSEELRKYHEKPFFLLWELKK
jgi:ubiquinone/menaquinone biosynthesis C-methylase UbiE